MAKLRKPIEVEAGSSDETENIIEPSDIVNGVNLADHDYPAAAETVKPDTESDLQDAPEDGADIPVEKRRKRDKKAKEKNVKEKKKKKVKEKPVKERKPREKKVRNKKEKPKRERTGTRGGSKLFTWLICAAVVLGLLTLWIYNDSNSLEKTFYQVKSSKVTDNIRIVAISDLHNKEFGKDNERLIYEISKLSPDMIAIVGDMMMEQQPNKCDVAITLAKKLGNIAPVYYSLGNHELDAMLFGGSPIYKDAKKQGIKILNNEVEKVEINGTPMDIIGLTQNPMEFEEYGRDFLNKTMEEDDDFKLLLNHYPEQFFENLVDYEFDLAIAGHAHGGQVRLPWIGGLYSADQGFFPELNDGYHEIGASKLLITRGLGKSGICPRINNTPEIMVIDLGWY